MRIERVRITGFGALAGVDLAWPEARVVLVVEPNETGKTTLCEAVVAALYGFPRGKGAGVRPRDLRRPRGGAPLAVALVVSVDGTRLAVERDLEAGTLRVTDAETGEDRTQEFVRAGRDVLGERLTGLTEPLFRSTAYVAQNVLDRDALDSALALELARVADSGGREASVQRALRTLEAVRSRMPESVTGSPPPSVEAEIVRLGRRVEEKRAEVVRLARAREGAREASERLLQLAEERAHVRRRAALAEAAVVAAERAALAQRRAALEERIARREALAAEATALARDAAAFSEGAVQGVAVLRSERDRRADALDSARRLLASERQAADGESRERARRLGPAAALAPDERERLRELLGAILETAEEEASATEAVEAQWDALRREGLAEDIRRLEALPADDREFLARAEEERASLELEGVKLDRRATDAQAQAAIAVAERRVRIARARALVTTSAVLAPGALALAAGAVPAPLPASAAAVAFVVSLAGFGGFAWRRAVRHRVEDEGQARRDEAAIREAAAATRRRLSELRLRLDQLGKLAGFKEPSSLLKTQRRARQAEEKRRQLAERRGRLEAVAGRRRVLDAELERFRGVLSFPAGIPSPDDARRFLALLLDVERAAASAAGRLGVLLRQEELLAAEAEAVAGLEARLLALLAGLGAAEGGSLEAALARLDSGLARSARHREIVGRELPALGELVDAGELPRLDARLAEVASELGERLAAASAVEASLPPFGREEDARRAADEAREGARHVEEAYRSAEREVAARVREGSERARELAESLTDLEALRERATVFRDAVDLARETLTRAASRAYGDFRSSLSAASREILAGWDLPYEGLEFGDDLAVAPVARGGRVLSWAELAHALSTGTREQIHLVARLAALRHLGTGSRGIPLLLDEPLAAADDARFDRVMRFLVNDVGRERPVLVVSCHEGRHRAWLDGLPEELRGRVAWTRLAPFGSRIDAGAAAE